MSVVVFRQLFYMLVIAALSFAFSRKNKFGSVQSAYASRLLLYFVNPVLILRSFLVPYSKDRLMGLLLSVAVAVVMHLLFTVLAMAAVKRHHRDDKVAGLERIAIVFTNCGFIGIPLINGALGQEAVFYLMGYIAVFNVYIWIFGAHEVGAPMNLFKVLTNPNVLAVIAGAVLFCLPCELPLVVRQPLAYIGDANTALSMILLGMLFAQFVDTPHEHIKTAYRRTAFIAVLRMAVSSLLAVMLTAAVWQVVPHSEMIHTSLVTCLIAALCPVGMSVSTFACVFCGTETERMPPSAPKGCIEGRQGASSLSSGKDGIGVTPQAYSSLLVLSTAAASVAAIPLCVRLAEVLM